MLCLMANRARHRDFGLSAQSSSSPCSAPHTIHCRTARSARHKASHRIWVRTSLLLAYLSLSWPSTDAMFSRQCRLSRGAAACLPMSFAAFTPNATPMPEVTGAEGGGESGRQRRGRPWGMFRNETQWSKLKRTTLSPVCYAYVKWPCSPGTTIALHSKLHNQRYQ